MKILILRVSAIGDVVHTLPALFLLKKKFPKAQICWVVQKKAASLIKNQMFIDRLWILPDKFLYPKNWMATFKILKEIKKVDWDVILDFQGIIKTSILLLLLRGKKVGFASGHARSALTCLFTNQHVYPDYFNIIQKNLALVDHLAIDQDFQKYLDPIFIGRSPSIDSLKEDFLLKIPKDIENEVNIWFENNNIDKFIALSPNTTWDSKLWPIEHWQNLLKKLIKNGLDHKIVILGESFGGQAAELVNFSKSKNLMVFSSPKLDLLGTAYLLTKTDLLIAPDTGLLHICDFLGINVIGIFGPTLLKKHGPFLNQTNITNSIQINCKHFYKKNHGFSSKNSKSCMYDLTPKELFLKINELLTKKLREI